MRKITKVNKNQKYASRARACKTLKVAKKGILMPFEFEVVTNRMGGKNAYGASG